MMMRALHTGNQTGQAVNQKSCNNKKKLSYMGIRVYSSVLFLSFRTDRSEQTLVIRLAKLLTRNHVITKKIIIYGHTCV